MRMQRILWCETITLRETHKDRRDSNAERRKDSRVATWMYRKDGYL